MSNYKYTPIESVTLISQYVREWGHDGLDGYALSNIIEMVNQDDPDGNHTDEKIMTAIWSLSDAWLQHQRIDGTCCNPLGENNDN